MAPERVFRGDFSGGILAEVKADGTVDIMVVGVTEKDRLDYLKANNLPVTTDDMKIKLLGGCADSPEATPGQVLEQEIREKAFEGKCVLGPSLLVFERRKRSTDPKALSAEHVQRFFLVTRWDGEVRKRDMLEDEGDEFLSPPQMVEFRKLHSIIFGTHLAPIFKAIEALAKVHSRVAGQYSDLLAAFNRGEIKPFGNSKRR